jgi:hypothetical protein
MAEKMKGEHFMELDQIIQMLKGKTEVKLVRFISDKGPNSCKACLVHHGKVFRADDPDKPKLPIHPNCRCKFVEIKAPDSKSKTSMQKKSTSSQFLQNLPEATQNALEMKYLPAVTGEVIGGVKAAAIIATEYKIWAGRTRNVVSKSKNLTFEEKLDIYEKIANALAKNDIRTILIIYNKYK